jgi:hypothetical protein
MYDDYDSQSGMGGMAMLPLVVVLVIILFFSDFSFLSTEDHPTYDKNRTEQAFQSLVSEKQGGIVIFSVSNFVGPHQQSSDDADENNAELQALIQDWKVKNPNKTFVCDVTVMKTEYKTPVPLEVWAITSQAESVDPNITRVALTGSSDEGKGTASFSIVDGEGGAKDKEGFVNNRNLLLAKMQTWLADNPTKRITGIGVDADSYGRPLSVVVQYSYR